MAGSLHSVYVSPSRRGSAAANASDACSGIKDRPAHEPPRLAPPVQEIHPYTLREAGGHGRALSNLCCAHHRPGRHDLAASCLLGKSALLTLATPWVRGKLGEARVRKRLARIWSEALHDVILPASRGGLTQVDHLVLTGAGLLVVETKNYRGRIFGREQEAQWTQRLGRHSIAFPNPLRQNHGHTEAVKALLPGVRVIGRVVFTNSAQFPQGMPPGVSSLRSLAGDLREELGINLYHAAPSEALLAAWEAIKARADQSHGARKAHLEGIADQWGPGRVKWKPYLILICSGLWLVWLGLRETGPMPPEPISRPEPARLRVPALVPGPTSSRLETRPGVTSSAPVLKWSDSAESHGSSASPECNSAIVAVLIDNSDHNQQRREQACGR